MRVPEPAGGEQRYGAHHLCVPADVVAGNGGLGRYFFLPGSGARARRIADRFADRVIHENPRQHDVFTGRLVDGNQSVDVGVVATGMGCPSLNIIVSELIDLGVRRLLRVGTAGSLQHEYLDVGDVVIATGAVRDEGSSDAFCPRDVPAVAHPDWVRCLSDAALAAGEGGRTFAGLVHSKDAFYGREFPAGPLADQNKAYVAMLEGMGVLASEMESAHLFVLSAAHGSDRQSLAARAPRVDVIKAGAVLAIIGAGDRWASAEESAEIEARTIDLAVAGTIALARHEG